MREIKFRAWDKVGKRFARLPLYLNSEGLLYVDNDPHGIQMNGHRSIGVRPNQYEFAGMFTGLLDKNRVEIYEGDILWTYEHGIGNLNREVIFDNGSFGVRHKHQLFTELRGWKKDYLEVIGNIHNNPELL